MVDDFGVKVEGDWRREMGWEEGEGVVNAAGAGRVGRVV